MDKIIGTNVKIIKYIIPFLVFLTIMGFLWQGLKNGDPHQLPSALIGTPAPTFHAPSLFADHPAITNQHFLGHVSLLNVWATWCITCRAEHAELMAIAKTHEVVIYGLNYKDDIPAARQWLTQYGDPYQEVIRDDKGAVAIDFGVYGTPETFIIDGHGVIQYKHIGVITPRVWEEEIHPLVQAITQEEKRNEWDRQP